MDLKFTLLVESDLSTLRSWFSDPELGRRYEYPTRIWFDYVSTEANVHAWMIRDDDLPVGHLQLDIANDGTGYIGFYVKPELRNQGYGRSILRTFLDRPEVDNLNRIVASAEVDNLASQRVLEVVGFVSEGSEPDEEGFLSFTYTKAEAGGK